MGMWSSAPILVDTSTRNVSNVLNLLTSLILRRSNDSIPNYLSFVYLFYSWSFGVPDSLEVHVEGSQERISVLDEIEA